MKKLLESQGLSHIVENISSYLDPKSLAQCRVVCQSWKDLIDNDQQWLIYQLEHIHNKEKIFVDYEENDDEDNDDEDNVVKSTIKARFPEWTGFIEEVSKWQNIPILKEIVNSMWIYFNNELICYSANPLHHAVQLESTLCLLNY